ncbi:MAG: hypothetical protein ABI345_09870 [Jatrophihabitans sp.]
MPDDSLPHDSPPDNETTGGEARKLFSVVQEWAQRNLPEPPSGHGGPECQWCPLCQFASILRGERPEVTDRMAEAGTALAQALHAFLETATHRAGAAKDGVSNNGAPRGPRSSTRPRPAPRVQHITLDDEPA